MNIGPKADGEFPEAAIKGLNELSEWIAVHKESVIGSYPLPEDESANVYATARDNIRYLFILSDTQKNVELKGIKKPKRVYLMLDMSNIDFSYREGNLVINTEDIKKHDAISKVDVIMIKI